MIWFWRAFRPRWHPFLWMLSAGTAVLLLAYGEVGYGALMVAFSVWLVARVR